MSFYSDLSQTAINLLTKYGQTCTLTKLTSGTFDPVLGGYTGQTSTDYDVKVVIDNYSNRLLDGTLIKAGDKKAYIESTVAPLIDNVLTVTDVDHKIINVKSISPGGTVVLYEAQIRA